MAWADIEVDASVDDVQARILDGLSDALGPDYIPVEGAPEIALAEEFATEEYATQQLAIAATQQAAALGFGVGMMGYPPFAANPATLPGVELQLLAPASAGDGVTPVDIAVIIPGGFTIATVDQSFATSVDLSQLITFTIISSGPNAGSYGGTMTVTMRAVAAGAAGNVAAGTPVTINSVASVAVLGANLTEDGTGGMDEESLTSYLTRFKTYASTLKPGGVRADELGTISSTVQGCRRALAVDLYDPAHPSTPTARTVTIIPVDATGQPLGSTTKTQLENYLETVREVNFIFHVIDPVYTPLTIHVDVTASIGADHTAVHDAVRAAVATLIDPAVWGTINGDPTIWTERTTLSVLDIAGICSPATIPGVAALNTVTINGGTTAVALTGPGALPAALGGSGSAVTVTVA